MYDLSGKVALVTGTSRKRGLGCGLALRLAQEGADVVVTDIHKPPETLDLWDREEGWSGIDSLVTEIKALGRRGIAITADLRNSQEITDMVEKVVKEFDKIDILINNAAGATAGDIGAPHVVDLSEEAWNNAIAVNLTGVFLMCKAVAKQMILQGQGGKIINISSVAGKMAQAGRAAYSASKAGEIALTQILAIELAPHKINVNAVCPGAIVSWGSRGSAIYEAMRQGLSENEAIIKVYSDLSVLQQIPMARPGTRDEILNVVAFLVSSQSDYITGQAINVDGGWFMGR